jgi:hypothetical protein
VAGAADRVPVRHVRARRADTAVDVARSDPAGLGSGALVAALPATAAAAAPPERTGFATGMTNATKTVGGALDPRCSRSRWPPGSIEEPKAGHAPLSGYRTVWSICAVAALLAALALLAMPKGAST